MTMQLLQLLSELKEAAGAHHEPCGLVRELRHDIGQLSFEAHSGLERNLFLQHHNRLFASHAGCAA